MNKCFVIAEIGINHGGNYDKAREMIYAAKESGADAVKFQIYDAEKRVGREHKFYDLLKKCELSYNDYARLKAYAQELDIVWFATPFDTEALDFMVNQLGVRLIKLASFDVPNIKFLQEVNRYASMINNMQVILSTGMSNYKEIEKAVATLSHVKHLALLHCVSSYPTPEDQVNLEKIRTLRQLFGNKCKIGYSDHSPTNDILAASLSPLLSATVIERHFMLADDPDCVDYAVSSDPASFKDLVSVVRLHERMLGDGILKLEDAERGTVSFRRIS